MSEADISTVHAYYPGFLIGDGFACSKDNLLSLEELSCEAVHDDGHEEAEEPDDGNFPYYHFTLSGELKTTADDTASVS